MRLTKPGLIKAALVALTGVAFFFCACAQRPPIVKKEPKRPAEAKGLLDRGEEFLLKGELDKALDAFAAYVAQNPHDPRSALCLHKMGQIHMRLKRPQHALDVLKIIEQRYPDYQDIVSVRYLMALALYDLGNYEESINMALLWTQDYPGHPLGPRVYLLLGRDYAALSDNPTSLKWLLKAYDGFQRAGSKGIQDAAEAITKVIEQSSREELTELAVIAKDTQFAPEIFHKKAFLSLQANDLEGAKEAAMALIRSTPDQYWVSLGKEILDRINEELSVARNKIGCLLPLSGPFGIFGQEVLRGMEMGMGLFSDSEDYSDIQVVLRDTEGKPELAEIGLEELVNDEKVIGILGPLRSKSADVAAGLAEQLGVPLITLTQKDGITEKGEMIYRNFISPSRETDKLVRTAIGELGIKRFAILYPDNAYGRYFMKLFWEKVEALGGEIRAAEAYSTDQTDFAEQIKKMVGLYYPRPDYVVEQLVQDLTPEEQENELLPDQTDPIIDFDAVFIPDYYKRVAMVAPQLIYHDVLDIWVLGTSQWQSPELIQQSGPYLQGALFTSGFFSKNPDPLVQDFVRRFEDTFDTTPGILAATGYDTIRFIKNLLRTGQIRTRRELQMAISEFRGIQGVTGLISFDPGGEVEKEPYVLTIIGRRMCLFQ